MLDFAQLLKRLVLKLPYLPKYADLGCYILDPFRSTYRIGDLHLEFSNQNQW